MARYVTPYLRLNFSFTEAADPQPLISSWYCNVANTAEEGHKFEQQIQYVRDGSYYVEYLTIVHWEEEEVGDAGEIIWPYAQVYYTFYDYESPDPPIIDFNAKCKIDNNGNLDVDTLEFIDTQVPDENTTFTSTKLNRKPRLVGLPSAVWVYDTDQGDWFWYYGDDALVLTQTGGGRYNDKLVFIGYDSGGNGAIYFK